MVTSVSEGIIVAFPMAWIQEAAGCHEFCWPKVKGLITDLINRLPSDVRSGHTLRIGS